MTESFHVGSSPVGRTISRGRNRCRLRRNSVLFVRRRVRNRQGVAAERVRVRSLVRKQAVEAKKRQTGPKERLLRHVSFWLRTTEMCILPSNGAEVRDNMLEDDLWKVLLTMRHIRQIDTSEQYQL